MGDTMNKQRLQNPLDVVEGVTHAGQAATEHTHTYTQMHTWIFLIDLQISII